jgi:hypothetical protein
MPLDIVGNTTASMVNLASYAPTLTTVVLGAIVIGILIAGTGFLAFKFFRLGLLGLYVAAGLGIGVGVMAGLIWVCYQTSYQAQTGNPALLYWIGGTIGAILTLLGLGYAASKTKWGQKQLKEMARGT